MFDPHTLEGKRSPMIERYFNRFGWLIVMSASLGFSTWSLFWIARHWGAPIPAAAIVSLFFDGAAILCADYSLKYARTGDSGFIPQCGVFTLAGLSAYLNSQHAALNHNPGPARILYAAPPIVAVVIYEFHVRWERRRALRSTGRIPEAMPVFGRYAWFLFPGRTLGVLRSITKTRLNVIKVRNTPYVFTGGSAELGETPEQFPGTNPGFVLMPGQSPLALMPGADETASPAAIRAWARSVGIRVPHRGPIPALIKTEYITAMNRMQQKQQETARSEPDASGNDSVPDSGIDEIREGYL
jgi:hypothetical protein